MKLVLAVLALAFTLTGCVKQSTIEVGTTPTPLERGRYLVKIAGCNDCHTPGYIMKSGNVEETQWLTGDTMSWVGPWGTTYARNLRIYFQSMTEDQWVAAARTIELRPPMPTWAIREMSEEDLRAIYKFTHSLGAAGEQAPAYLPPGVDAPLPRFVLQLPPPPAPAPEPTPAPAPPR
jgi:mono/diheme cytochrome c family protein